MKEQSASPSTDFFSRLRTVSPMLYALDRKPLIPDDFRFPLENLASLLAKHLEREVSIALDERAWRTQKELDQEKKEKKLRELSCSVFGIPSLLSLFFPEDALTSILADLVQCEIPSLQMHPTSFLKTFEAFLFAQVVASIKACSPFEKMELMLIDQVEKEMHEGYLVSRYTVCIGKTTTTLLIAQPAPFLDQLRALPQSKEHPPRDWLTHLPLFPIQIEAARTHMSMGLLKAVKPGDVILVDFPFYIPGSERARVILTYRGKPIFRAKVKNGAIKLLEMSQNLQAFQPVSPLSRVEEITSESTQPRDLSMNPLNKKAPSTPINQSEEEEEFSLETTEEKFSEESAQEKASLPKGTTAPLSFHDLPLLVVVQLKELSMTLDELQALQPGNLLDLDIHPEHAIVQLSVQGQIIGEGDLIRIGDKIGVRVRSMGAL